MSFYTIASIGAALALGCGSFFFLGCTSDGDLFLQSGDSNSTTDDEGEVVANPFKISTDDDDATNPFKIPTDSDSPSTGGGTTDPEGSSTSDDEGCPAGEGYDSDNQCSACFSGWYSPDGSTQCFQTSYEGGGTKLNFN